MGSAIPFFMWYRGEVAIAVFLYDPSREKGVLKSPQAFQNPKLKNLFSADDAQSTAERIPNRFSVRAQPKAYVQCLIHPLLVGGGDLPGALPQAVLIQRADLL